jgi:hypothetical protein
MAILSEVNYDSLNYSAICIFISTVNILPSTSLLGLIKFASNLLNSFSMCSTLACYFETAESIFAKYVATIDFMVVTLSLKFSRSSLFVYLRAVDNSSYVILKFFVSKSKFR